MGRGEKASATGGGDYFRNEEPSRRGGRYTKMTASRRSSKGAKVLLRWMPSRLAIVRALRYFTEGVFGLAFYYTF